MAAISANKRWTAASSSDLTIQGVAATRDDLVAFEDRMKADAGFSGVTIPPSDFAPDSNLPFSLSVSATQ